MKPLIRDNGVSATTGPARAALLLVPLAIALVGCSSFRTEWGGPPVREGPAFAEGRTTVAEVVQTLGAPTKIGAMPDGFVFLYEHSILNEFQFGLSLDYSYLRFVKIVHARTRIEREGLLLMFDDEGALQSLSDYHWNEKLSGGWAGQFLYSAVSLTDPDVRQQRADPHRWGRSCLAPLPVTLNSEQSLRSGAHGLQLALPPKYAGQHTLEMIKPVKPRKRKPIGSPTHR